MENHHFPMVFLWFPMEKTTISWDCSIFHYLDYRKGQPPQHRAFRWSSSTPWRRYLHSWWSRWPRRWCTRDMRRLRRRRCCASVSGLAGWWWLEHDWLIFPYLLGMSSSQLTFIFFREGLKPPTRLCPTEVCFFSGGLFFFPPGLKNGVPPWCWTMVWKMVVSAWFERWWFNHGWKIVV